VRAKRYRLPTFGEQHRRDRFNRARCSWVISGKNIMALEYRGERFSGYNKPKRTPNHPKKSHAVLAKEGSRVKMIRFGEQGAKTAGKPKAGESQRMKKKRASFKARHAKNIKKGKMSAAYWADKVKW
jgi:hypothetical protein